MRNATCLLLLVGLVAGCAETGRSGFEARMSGLVGQSEAALVGRMGPPGYDHTYEGRRSLGYSETWTETVFQPGGRGLFQELTRRCEVIFARSASEPTLRPAGFIALPFIVLPSIIRPCAYLLRQSRRAADIWRRRRLWTKPGAQRGRVTLSSAWTW